MFVPPGIAANALVFGQARECVYFRHRRVIVPHPSSSSIRIWQRFSAVTSCWKEGFLTHLCYVYTLFQYSEARASLHLVSMCQVRRICQHVHFLWFHHGQNSIVHGNSDLFFFVIRQTELVTLIRDGRIDTDWIHGMNCLKTRVPFSQNLHWSEWYFCLFCAAGLHDWKRWCLWRQDDQCLWIAVSFCGLCDPTVPFDRENRQTISLPILDPEMSNVLYESLHVIL